MANVLGSLLVELGLNSAAFVEGMDKATYKAKQAAKEISDSLSGMGESLSKLLEPFGELGAKFGETFGGVADILKSVAGEMGGLGGAAGAAALGIGGLIAAGAAVEGAFVGLALHSAESAGELYKLSQQTGVSVEDLSKLGFAATEVGVSQEAMARGMQMMARQAFAAATGTGRMSDTFKRLGVDVKDSNGDLKDAGELFRDVAEKVANLDNSTEKIAVMRSLFGRMGPQLLPLVNNLDEFTKRAEELGMVISTKTAKASEEFEMDLRAIGQGATGVGNQLLDDLLPIFKTVSEYMVDGLKEVVAWTKNHSAEIKTVTQYAVSFGGIVFMVFGSLVDMVVDAVKGVAGLELAIWHLGQGVKDLSWSEIKNSAKEAMDAVGGTVTNELNDLGNRWLNYQKLVGRVFDETAKPTATEKKGTTKLDMTPKAGAGGSTEKDVVTELIEKLESQAKAELNLASAVDKSTAAMTLKKAAEEGEKQIADVRASLQAKELQLVDQISAANAAGNAQQAAALQKKLESLAKYLTNLQTLAPKIVELHEEIAAGQFAAKAGEASAKQTEQYQEQIADLEALGAAYDEGGNAIERADIEGKLKKEKVAISDMNSMLEMLKESYGEADPAVVALTQAIDGANASLEKHRQQLQAIKDLNYSNEIKKIIQSYSDLSDGERAVAVARSLSQFDLSKAYDDQITKLQDVKAVQEALGQSTLLVDAAIYDAQNKLNKQWDEAAIKMGGFRDKVGGVLDEIRMDGDNMWEGIAQAGKTALDGLTDALAKFVVTGKGSFKQVAQSFEENITKSIFKKAESSLAGGVENMLGLGPGTLGGSKPDGSSEQNALWVQVAGQGGMSGEEGGMGGLFGNIDKLFGGGQEEGGGGIMDSITNAISGIFGGALASGGDVTPGKAYIVGEKHPEFFVPKREGSVVPTLKTGNENTTSLSVHFHGVTDMDSFKKSKAQIASTFHRQAQIAFSRGT